MQSNLKVGIIGTGFGKITGLNFKAIDPSIKLYYSGRDKDKLIKLKEEIEIEGIFTDWKELITSVDLDLLVIASISSQHKEMFDFASQFNISILIEKPAALSSTELTEMDTNRNEKNLIVVNHEGRFNPVVDYIKDLIDTEKLGKILTIRSGAYLNWYSNEEYKETWNQKKDLGGGQLYSIGTHQLDLILYLLGSPKITDGNVQTMIFKDSRFLEEPTSDSQFSAHFTTSEGTSIQLYNDCYCFGYKDFTLEVLGDKGIVIYSDQRGLKISYSNKQPLEEIVLKDSIPTVTLGNSILTKSMKYMVKALLNSITTGKYDPRFCSLEDEKFVLYLFEKYS